MGSRSNSSGCSATTVSSILSCDGVRCRGQVPRERCQGSERQGHPFEGAWEYLERTAPRCLGGRDHEADRLLQGAHGPRGQVLEKEVSSMGAGASCYHCHSVYCCGLSFPI